MKDYSDYLDKNLDWIEKSWAEDCKQIHDSYAKAVNDTVKKFKLKSIIEIGCGTGKVAQRLKYDGRYYGIDANSDCIKIARKNNAGKKFITTDVRKIEDMEADLVCAFSILKHFGLHEWADIFKKIASLGDYLIFNMPIAEQTKDDGTEFHHVWMNFFELEAYLECDAGFEIIEIRHDNPIEPIFICKRKVK